MENTHCSTNQSVLISNRTINNTKYSFSIHYWLVKNLHDTEIQVSDAQNICSTSLRQEMEPQVWEAETFVFVYPKSHTSNLVKKNIIVLR